MQISVIIVDDCPVIREGLKLLLEKQDYIKVTAEVNNIGELPNVLKNNVIFINLVNKPLEIQTEISLFIMNRPGFSFILLTGKVVNHSILDCIEQGVHGILNINSKADEMHSAVLSVAAGESFVHLPLSRIKSKIIQHVRNEHAERLDSTELTERETEVLKLFAEGLTYKEIGNKLFISPRTVESHKNNILNKLELKSSTDMIKFAIKHQLINL
jgi:DNA-binding NarL/FixJ family response regulator